MLFIGAAAKRRIIFFTLANLKHPGVVFRCTLVLMVHSSMTVVCAHIDDMVMINFYTVMSENKSQISEQFFRIAVLHLNTALLQTCTMNFSKCTTENIQCRAVIAGVPTLWARSKIEFGSNSNDNLSIAFDIVECIRRILSCILRNILQATLERHFTIE